MAISMDLNANWVLGSADWWSLPERNIQVINEITSDRTVRAWLISEVQRTIWRGRQASVVHAVRESVRRNPPRHQKRLAAETGVSMHSTTRIFRVDLQLGKYRRCVSYLLTSRLKKMRLTRCAALLKHFRGILFTNEEIFISEEKTNKQNDRIYAQSRYEAMEKTLRVQRGYRPTSKMVW